MDIVTIQNADEEKFLRTPIPRLELGKLNREKLRELVREMRASMRALHGVGLAANQVGHSLRFFVAEVSDRNGRKKFYAVFNPEIVATYDTPQSIEEGCLSVPAQFGMVARFPSVMLRALTLNGKVVRMRAWGLLAQVFQHEVDHLDGKLFTDIATDLHTVPASARPAGRER